jgi:hypothetical protein
LHDLVDALLLAEVGLHGINGDAIGDQVPKEQLHAAAPPISKQEGRQEGR